jgi:hypothetical protein
MKSLRSLFLALAVMITGPVVSATAQSGGRLYLPLVFNAHRPPGLYGLLLQAGAPVVGQQVELFRYTLGDPDTAVPQGTATSTDTGSFGFPAVPVLSGAEAYFVRWVNSSQTSEGRAYVVFSNDITAYDGSQPVMFANLDIADIVLIGPTVPPAGVSLPVALQWAPRPATPADNHQVRFFNANFTTLLATSPALGYTGSYTLTTLPSGLVVSTDYQWDVIVDGPGNALVVPWQPLFIRFTTPPLSGFELPGLVGLGPRPVPDGRLTRP